MKKMKEQIMKGLVKSAYVATKMNVDSACALFMYQDKLPESAKKLSKLKDDREENGK